MMKSVHPLRGVVSLAIAASAASAGTPQPFTEEAVSRGIDYPVEIGLPQSGMGLGLFDIDGDGDADAMVLGAADGRVGLYENDGAGNFTDRTYDGPDLRMEAHTDYAGISAADYDGDGDLDIYLGRAAWQLGGTGNNVLYRNDGNWNFTEVAAAAGVDDDGFAFATCWGDYNGDGRLDLYVSNRTNTNNNTAENRLFENQGDGTFVDVAAAVGAQAPGDPTLVSTFFDYDSDGDADLYLGTDKGSGFLYANRFLENNGGVYTDITAYTGTEAYVDCMGIAVGDITRDGLFDLYVTNVPLGHVLLVGEPDGTYTDMTAAAGMEVFTVGWGTFCIDYDNDTWEDMYVCGMMADNVLFHNPGSFPMVDVAPAMGVNTMGTSYSAAMADIDNDGDVDIMTTEQGEQIRLYINNEGSSNNWAKFNVVGQGENTFGVGAQIRVRTAGVEAQIREVRAGHHYKAQDPTTIHFGLADATEIIKTFIDWPGTGDQRLLQHYPVNQTWTLYPPERIGDIDLDGDVDIDDRWAVLDRYHLNTSEPIVPGIEVIDADGDADFDLNDVLLIGLPCPADVAPPYGVLDLADVNGFIAGFVAHDPIADMNGDGVYDLTDVGLFITGFTAGCE